MALSKEPPPIDEWVSVDIDPNAPNVHVVHDLNVIPWPFEDNSFDEIHAYEILEHLGRQGDYRSFFDQMWEVYRILKPNGLFYVTCPHHTDKWAWGDPGHTRVLDVDTFSFLDQKFYDQVGHTSATDYRWYWKGNIKLLASTIFKGASCYVGRAIK